MKIRLGLTGDDIARRRGLFVATALSGLDLEVNPIDDLEEPALVDSLFKGAIDVALVDGVRLQSSFGPRASEGWRVAAWPEREARREVWSSNLYPHPVDIPPGETVVADTPLRRVQIANRFPRLRTGAGGGAGRILPEYEPSTASERYQIVLGPTEMTPALGQGAYALVARREEEEICARLESLDHAATRREVHAEHTLARELGKNDSEIVVAGLARVVETRLIVLGMIADPEGRRIVRLSTEGLAADPEAVACDLAGKLLRAGGDILGDG